MEKRKNPAVQNYFNQNSPPELILKGKQHIVRQSGLAAFSLFGKRHVRHQRLIPDFAPLICSGMMKVRARTGEQG
ncbi:hypothetical protein, partial [Pontibacter beigongshangensis]|uniref:hypothetical protein n=1 Tax=Pontibacter beigongshangensis TaxID=2574733 RepID=UPI0019D56F28